MTTGDAKRFLSNELRTENHVLVTPEFARELLSLNIKNNRVLRPGKVAEYTDLMRRGKWLKDTSAAISITKSGLMVNGQHRLHAVIAAGIAVMLNITCGVDEEAFKYEDSHAPKSTKDIFDISGHRKLNTRIISAITFTLSFKKGGTSNISIDKLKKTPVDVLEIYESDKLFWDKLASDALYLHNRSGDIVSYKIFAGMYAVLRKKNSALADDFMQQLSTGENITNKTILALRRQLTMTLAHGKRFTTDYKVAIMTRAWNYFRQDKEVTFIRHSEGDSRQAVM